MLLYEDAQQQPVTGTLSVPLRLIPPMIQREILEAANHGQASYLTFTIKRSSCSNNGFTLETGYGKEALLEFDIRADNITFE